MANGLWVGSVNESVSRRGAQNVRVTVTDPANGDFLGLYRDREGLLPIGNPFLTREDGLIKFFVRAGRINIEAYKSGISKNFENEIVLDDWTGEAPPDPPDLCDLTTFAHFAGSEAFSQNVYDIAYNGSGVMLAMQQGHLALKSADGGDTWDAGVVLPGLVNFFDRYNGVAYGNGVFAAVGGGNRAVSAYSSDGTSWSTATNGASVDSIVFGNGVFVAVGNDGSIKTSTDGATWTTRRTDSGGFLSKVDYAGGVFMCCGYTLDPSFACIVLRSTDNGATWTEVFSSGTWNDAISIAASDAAWVVLSDAAHGTTDVYRTSIDDGDTWVARNTTIPLSDMTSDSCWVYLIGDGGTLYSLEDFAVAPVNEFSFTVGGFTPYGRRIPGVGAVFWAQHFHKFAP